MGNLTNLANAILANRPQPMGNLPIVMSDLPPFGGGRKATEAVTAANRKDETMAREPGPREKALREMRSAKAETKPADRKQKAKAALKAAEAPKAAKPGDKVVKVPAVAKAFSLPNTAKKGRKAPGKPTKAPKRTKAPQPAGKTERRPDGLREGSKGALMLDTAVAAGTKGITESDLCAAIGWKKCAVTLRRVCAQVGAKCERKDGKFVVTLKKAIN